MWPWDEFVSPCYSDGKFFFSKLNLLVENHSVASYDAVKLECAEMGDAENTNVLVSSVLQAGCILNCSF